VRKLASALFLKENSNGYVISVEERPEGLRDKPYSLMGTFGTVFALFLKENLNELPQNCPP
jgi:hypothetical protein